MNLLMYPHGGSGNHGCEAIVRSTVALTCPDHASLISFAPEEDFKYGLHSCCDVVKASGPIKKYSAQYILAAFRSRILKDADAFDSLAYEPLLQEARISDLALSIGGDNYCYGSNSLMFLLNRLVRKNGRRNVLWGCSIEPGRVKGELLDDLNGYDLVVARESITYNALKEKLSCEVLFRPDPAFAMEAEPCRLPQGFEDGNTVGINLSPMFLDWTEKGELILENIVSLIEIILKESDMSVALIPHVVWNRNDDREPLFKVKQRFSESERVFMVEDCPARNLKYIISKCRLMIAARTHACIAAYSSQVPVIALGYSCKSRGIANDIFRGTDNHWYLPVTSFTGVDDLVEMYKKLMDNEMQVRRHLSSVMSEYIALAAQTGELL